MAAFGHGPNYDGQLGDGTGVSSLVPGRVGTETSWQSVSAGAGAWNDLEESVGRGFSVKSCLALLCFVPFKEEHSQ